MNPKQNDSLHTITCGLVKQPHALEGTYQDNFERTHDPKTGKRLEESVLTVGLQGLGENTELLEEEHKVSPFVIIHLIVHNLGE